MCSTAIMKGVMPPLNTDTLDGTVFISDNLPFLKSLDNESVDLVIIDPPFGKRQTFEGTITPPLTADEQRIERELMETWEVYDAATAYELGLEYPDQSGTTAKFEDIWSFRRRVQQGSMERFREVCPGAYLLINATRRTHSDGIAAYIAFMVERMLEIKRVLKPTGSVYVHCDHEANAYLRQMMDAVFGKDNFRNEIVWAYRTGGVSRKYWPRKHDTLLFYVRSDSYDHRPLQERVYYEKPFFTSDVDEEGNIYADVYIRDVWDDIKPLINVSGERTGYPTQKPQTLAVRMIEASSDPGDLVLDCFAGCAYVPVAAQLTGRRWMACDMSPRAWTVVRRQFHKHPQLGIVTEGEVAADDADNGKIEQKLENGNRVIKVRGPHDLPERTTVDDPPPSEVEPLAELRYRQTPRETSAQIWDAFVDEWGPQCWYCGTQKVRDRRELHLDHIEPNRRDGTNDDCWNRAIACAICNGNKGAELTPEQTIQMAHDQGIIQTDALRREVLEGFRSRQMWAKLRWEQVKRESR